jgi:hypothetical protein
MMDVDFIDLFGFDAPPKLIWQGKDKEYEVCEMEVSHIENCVKLLTDKRDGCQFWLDVFEDELKRRNRND